MKNTLSINMFMKLDRLLGYMPKQRGDVIGVNLVCF